MMKTKMSAKRVLALILTLLMCFALMVSFTGCKKDTVATNPTESAVSATSDEITTPDETATVQDTKDDFADVWADAIYTEDTAIIGTGATTFYFEVQVGSHSVTFTVNTDKETVGDALLEHGIIAGEEGAYGLYVKTVNGILADYDVNATYWSFTKGGEMMMTGVDGENIESGAHYEMVYTKG